jgi:hypothetical protein
MEIPILMEIKHSAFDLLKQARKVFNACRGVHLPVTGFGDSKSSRTVFIYSVLRYMYCACLGISAVAC